ncbi:hypothetical protein SAMN05421640_1034 [Ekhidna lutea]|uniref:RES domain-containing protein n=1 Tax=Ekhidna lutea TaxID=447679 RepID=A0A239GW37_EKHLU|nr:hypothetical protein [Ekhidna lutea]SNS73350.1 hypothetical protein SAMN05421640_1034 [Ekhidna lutea]
MNDSLAYLRDVRDRLQYVDYDMIYASIVDLKDKFVPTARLKKGHIIDRVRINREGEIFTKIEDVSYIHDKEVLENHVGFGRANLPGEAVFYGSIISKNVPHPRVVAYFETSELVKNLNDKDIVEEKFTLSRWRVTKDIEVLEMIFSDEALKVNEYVQMSLEDKLTNLETSSLKEHAIDQGKFFSNEFARTDVKNGEEYKYKITAAYMNYICKKMGLGGITYPSVPTEFKGQNVALYPQVVDNCLDLETVGLFQFKGKDVENLIYMLKYCQDFGEGHKDFKWLDYQDGIKIFD